MTRDEAQEWLKNVNGWWDAVHKDMKALKDLLDKHINDPTLDPGVVDKIERLLKDVAQPRMCLPVHPTCP